MKALALWLLPLLACGQKPAPTVHTASKEPVMNHTITFHPGRAYEVTGIWIREGQKDALDAYFAEVFPLASSEFGVTPLFGLEPVRAYAGDFMPDVMFVNEWPSLDHFQRFVADPRAKDLFPRRDAAVERLVVTQYAVPESRTVSLGDGDVVEFAAMWIKPGEEDALGRYYRDAVKVALDNGLSPLTGLSPMVSYRGDFSPSRAGLNHWGTLDNFDRFVEAAAALFPRRDAALERLEVTHARVRFGDAR